MVENTAAAEQVYRPLARQLHTAACLGHIPLHASCRLFAKAHIVQGIDSIPGGKMRPAIMSSNQTVPPPAVGVTAVAGNVPTLTKDVKVLESLTTLIA